MAKSIRSKKRRKMRAIKRERYGKKELERLKQTLGIKDVKKVTDVEMTELQDVATVVQGNVIEFSLKKKKEEKPKRQARRKESEGEEEPKVERMDIVKETLKSGQYPKWMNQRQIRKLAKAVNRRKKKSTKKLKKKKKLKAKAKAS